MIVNKIQKIYYKMQKYPMTKKIVIFLQRRNLVHKIKYLFGGGQRDRREASNPTKVMLESRKFFQENQKRIHAVMEIMADDLSRDIYLAVWNYKMFRTPILKKFYNEKNQYLVDGILELEENEVFIDGGGYVGDTIEKLYSYAEKRKIRIKKIITFEPEKSNFMYIQKMKKKYPEIVLIKKGLSWKEGNLFFDEKGVCAKIVDKIQDATTKIPVINIDAVNECRDATYIKMDIEGAEINALKGAENTILKNHPKLAICIYHKDTDMIQIIEYIHQLVPEYKIYVRHHSRCQNETVCYAVD